MVERSTVVVGACVLVVLLIVQRARAFLQLNRIPIQKHAAQIVPIALGVVGLNNLPQFFAVARDNPYEFVDAGLSSSNLITAVSSALVSLGSVYLLTTKRPLGRNVFSGASFWVMMLFLLYAASSAWSIFPTGTAFRSLEIIAYYVVAVFIFSGPNALGSLYWIMLLHATLGAIPLLSAGLEALRAGFYYGFVQSNQYSLYAAVFLLLHYHLHRRNLAGYLYGMLLFVGFGSTSTAAAFLVALLTYAVYRRPVGLCYALRIPLIGTAVAVCIGSIFFPDPFGRIFEFVGPIVQKDVDQFYTATGRTLIWEVYVENLKNVPFGIGFYSERVFLDPFAGAEVVAPNAHNGFISAWIGAGFPALLCLVTIYLSTVMHLRRQSLPIRRVCYSLVSMLFINSMTYPGIGGYFTMWYFVLATVIVLSNTPSSAGGQVQTFHGRGMPATIVRARPRAAMRR